MTVQGLWLYEVKFTAAYDRCRSGWGEDYFAEGSWKPGKQTKKRGTVIGMIFDHDRALLWGTNSKFTTVRKLYSGNMVEVELIR